MRILHFKLITALSILILTSSAFASSFSSWSPEEQEVFSIVNQQRSLNGLNFLNADSRLQDAASAHSLDMAVNNYFSHTGSDNSTPSERIQAAGYNWNFSGENIAAEYGYNLPAISAARAVMFGTDNLSEISTFSTTNGKQAVSSWDLVGADWDSALWDSWHKGWMGSTGHRQNILTAGFTDLGVGLVVDNNDTSFSLNGAQVGPFYTYWTQNFAAGDTALVPLPSALWLLLSALASLSLARNHREM